MTDQKDVKATTTEKLLDDIAEKEPNMAFAIRMVIEHVHGTYSDKYQNGINENGIDTKSQLYGKNGAAINSYQVQRYLQRYGTTGSRKSYLVVDLLKAVHYICFEITRRIRNNDFEIHEPII